MITQFNRASVRLTVVVLALTLLSGCSSKNNDSNSSQTRNVSSSATSSNTLTSSTTTSTVAKTLLLSIKSLAMQGKVIDCDFAAKNNTIDDVINQWGQPDTSDYIASAKGTYDTYSKHNLAFGFNKGEQLLEIRTFDKQL